MFDWSDNDVHPSFELKIFLDTNVWVYLVDKTHPKLNLLFDILTDHKFVRLVSSEFVVFEFSGVRKREHYLRQLAKNSLIEENGAINFSSMIRSLDSFKSNDPKFEDVVEEIKNSVNSDIEKITSEYNVEFDYSINHRGQIKPAIELCISTKINNQDSLVLLSAVHPRENNTNDNIQILTNDTAFISESKKPTSTAIIESLGKKMPLVQDLEKFRLTQNGKSFNLINKEISITSEELSSYLNQSLPALMASFNKALFLGKTFLPKSESLPENLICFNLEPGIPIKLDVYLVIVSSSLEFIYSTKHTIKEIQKKRTALVEGFFLNEDETDRHVSFLLFDENSSPISSDISNAIRQNGNLIFIHPDS